MSTEPAAFRIEDLNAAIDHLNSKPLTDEARTDLTQQIGEQVSSPEVLADLAQSVEKLSGFALNIDTNFDNIGKLLTTVHAKVPQELQDAMTGMPDKWQGYRKRYVDLLWDSRRLADDARAVVDDIRTILLPFLWDDSNSVVDKRKAVEDYRKILDVNEPKAAIVSQGFTELHQNVTQFKLEWKEIVDKSLTESGDALKAIEDDIKRLTEEIESLTSKMTSLWVATGLGLLGVCLLMVLSPVCAIIVGVLVIKYAAIPAIDVTLQRKEKLKELDQKKAEREKLAATLEVVKQVGSDLTKAEESFSQIFTGLDAFASIWATIRSDINYVSGRLKVADKAGYDSLLLGKRLKSLNELYFALGKALERYAKIVSEDHDLFKGREETPAELRD